MSSNAAQHPHRRSNRKHLIPVLFALALVVGSVSLLVSLQRSQEIVERQSTLDVPDLLRRPFQQDSPGVHEGVPQIKKASGEESHQRQNGAINRQQDTRSWEETESIPGGALRANPEAIDSITATTSRDFHRHMEALDEDGFSACLLTMEDNHYLIEWLAYHYHFLPLRRLIIAVDPASRTSPQEVLDRYLGLINITVWGDEEVFRNESIPQHRVYRHRKRQSLVFSQCLAQFKAENRTWVLGIDTDEYVTVHSGAFPDFRLDTVQPTLYQTLQMPNSTHVHISTDPACISLRRAQMGIRLTPSKWQVGALPWNWSNFNTLQQRDRAQKFYRKPNRPSSMSGKTIVHAQRITLDSLDHRYTGPHRPTLHCPNGKTIIKAKYSTYIVHHYPGSFSQYTFRYGSDARSHVRTLDRYYELNFTDDIATETNDIPWTWVEDFVRKVGLHLARKLLKGVGQVEKNVAAVTNRTLLVQNQTGFHNVSMS